MEDESRLQKEEAGGYFITHQIERALLEEPDLVTVNQNTGEIYSLVFGKKREGVKGDPDHSAYLLVIRNDGSTSMRSAGGVTREDALMGLGVQIKSAVLDHEKMA